MKLVRLHAMRPDEERVRVLLEQRVEGHQVLRVLEDPPPVGAPLQLLESSLVCLEHRSVVGVEQPVSVRRDVIRGDRGRVHECPVREQVALLGAPGGKRVARLQLRRCLSELGLDLGDPRVRLERLLLGRWRRQRHLPEARRAHTLHLTEQPVQVRGPGARQPHDEDRRLDDLVGDRRVPRAIVDEPEPFHQETGQRLRRRGLAWRVEAGLTVQRVDEDVERLGEGDVAEVVEARLGDRDLHQRRAVQVTRHGSSPSLQLVNQVPASLISTCPVIFELSFEAR
jgi:hypothetical protein